MIKTHKPRGYLWTNASAFQQTKEFRNISYDECIATNTRSLSSEAEESLQSGTRQRKRRRIEKLADDFLNGEPLIISSARPCPESLKATITWNQKSSTEPKFKLAPLTATHTSDAPLWQDIDDDDDDAILLRHGSLSKELHIETSPSRLPPEQMPGQGSEQQEPEPVKSRPSRRYRPPNLRSGPSSDALRKAAALRARKAYHAQTEPEEFPPPDRGSNRQLRSSDNKAQSRQRTEWLQRKDSTFVSARSDFEEDSLDELRLSRIETPTNPPKRPITNAIDQAAGKSADSSSSGSASDLGEDSDSIIVTPRISETTNLIPDDSLDTAKAPDKPAHTACLESNSYHTAHEETDVFDCEQVEADGESQGEDSQARLLKSHGFEGAPPSSWKAVNQPQTDQDVALPRTKASVRDIGVGSSSRLEPPEPQTAPRSLGKSTRHAAASQSDAEILDRPALMTRRRAMYRSELATANESSPLQWRKWQRKVTFPSSDEIIVESRHKIVKDAQQNSMSQSAPVTPAATAAQRSSNKQTASAQVDVARSSPVLTSHTPTSNTAGVTILQLSLPEAWIGTQAMLLQAQRDLITSPEKPGHTPTAENDKYHDLLNEGSQNTRPSQKCDREPLKQLSQEPMPSTQAMIGDFPGFSTVKKPWRGGPRESIDSPSVLLRKKEAMPTSKDPDPLNISGDGSKSTHTRPSRLRFSLESVESPLQSTNLDLPSPTSPIIRRGADWSSTDVATSSKKSSSHNAGNNAAKSSLAQQQNHVADGSDGVHRSEESQSASFSSVAALPSFQAAQQAWSSLQLSNEGEDDGNIDQTIEELTTYMLDTTDIDAVLN